MIASSAFRSLLIPVALVGALSGFVAGCGDSDSASDAAGDAATSVENSEAVQKLREKGDELQQGAQSIQDQALQIGEDVKSGKISSAEGKKLLEEKAKELEDEAKAAGAGVIGAVDDATNLSDSDKQKLEDAKDALTK